MEQLNLPNIDRKNHRKTSTKNEYKFFTTRYQGSKVKILPWIWSCIKNLQFEYCLDAFGGTGSVAYLLKVNDKTVDYNDNLKFNYTIGKAIIENENVFLGNDDIDNILRIQRDIKYRSLIRDTFKDIFYPDEENAWLDTTVQNINRIENDYKQAIAFTALFQSCIIKRPYNLFHRANLYMRTAEVKRNFGNKATWDKPFPDYFRKFAQEVNDAVFSNGKKNRAYNKDVFSIDPKYDLIYIDTPYMNDKGSGVDYLDFYHFLEGLLDYHKWENMIDHNYKHKRLKGEKSLWCDKNKIYDAFDKLFNHFKNGILVVSYRSNGIPSEQDLIDILSRYKNVEVHRKIYKYALSTQNGHEILLVGT